MGRLAGVHVPVQPYRRTVFVARPLPELERRQQAAGRPLPLTVDLDTGWYVHRDRSGHLLLGGTDRTLYPGFDTAVDWADLQRVLAAAVQRMPLLAEAQVMRGYAGLREITPDFHCILGPAPGLANFYLCCGFSGHGFMHAPAAGILMAELLLDGRARSLDIAPLLLDRFQAGASHPERVTF